MDEALLAAYRDTAYLVCVDAAQWPCIRIDEALPATLQALVGDAPWGFITAWHPHSAPRAEAVNTAAQRRLLQQLHASTARPVLYPAIGIGCAGWYEPSLFVIGLPTTQLDRLCRDSAQDAYVHGRGSAPACLRLVPAPPAAACHMDSALPHCGQSGQ